jgi:hypothetical protein
MNKQQKVDFLKRLSKGKADLKEITHCLDLNQQSVSWFETDILGMFRNASGEKLSIAEIIKKKDQLNIFITSQGLPDDDDNENWIVFK